MLSDKQIQFFSPPTPVGWWDLPGSTKDFKFSIASYKKPRWLTRFLMRVVFEWGYRDA